MKLSGLLGMWGLPPLPIVYLTGINDTTIDSFEQVNFSVRVSVITFLITDIGLGRV